MTGSAAKDESVPVCLTIAGLDPSGGAGIIADIRTFSAYGCFAAAAVTSVTFQNTQGVYGSVSQVAETIRGQLDPVFDDYEVSAVKTGMLPNEQVIVETASVLKERGVRTLVVDPVVRSTSGFDLIDDSALSALADLLFPISTLITPNIPEAERITGLSIGSEDDADRAALKMISMGASNVLIKGGHSDLSSTAAAKTGTVSEKRSSARRANDILYLGEQRIVLKAEYIETNATHGTGCVLAAAITANLARGRSLEMSVREAKRFVHLAISSAPLLGKGHSPVNISPELARIENKD